MQPDTKIFIIVPCYNEEKRLQTDFFINFLKDNKNYAFLFVNDGSIDNTLTLLQTNAKENDRFCVLNLEKNEGKAEAVRRGMLYVFENYDCDFIGFWDADLATPLFEIHNFVHIIQKYDCDMVTGLRLMRLGAKVKRKSSRHYLGRIFATVASKTLKLPVYDTQCGAKLYKKQIVKPLFTNKFISKWLFDVEILARYINFFGHQNAIEKIYESPLFQWEDMSGSQLKVKDFVKAPIELWKIRKQYLSK